MMSKYIKLLPQYVVQFTLLFIVIGSLSQCKNVSAEPSENTIPTANQAPEISIPKVRVAPVTFGSFTTTINATGRIIAKKMGPVVSEASGKLVEVYFKEGDFVEEGQLLATLDRDRLLLDIEQAHNDLDKAAYDRQIKIIEAGGDLGDSTFVDPIIDKNINIQVGYPSVMTKIKQLQLELSRRQIYAPYSGVITEQLLFRNQQISTGQPLYTILDRSSIVIEGYILDEDIDNVTVGQKVSYNTLGGGEARNARVAIKRNLAGEETRMITVECKPSSTRGLVLGQSVQININSTKRNVMSAPRSAVVKRSGRDVVFTYDEIDKVAKWNYVEIGDENDELITVLNGISKEMIIIVEGNLNLAHDERVEL